MSSTHRRQQFDTVTPIVRTAEVYDSALREHIPFTGDGWTVYFRMWRLGAANESTVLVVDDAEAEMLADGVMSYSPVTADVAVAARFVGMFLAVSDADDTEIVEWPQFAVEITPVAGVSP